MMNPTRVSPRQRKSLDRAHCLSHGRAVTLVLVVLLLASASLGCRKPTRGRPREEDSTPTAPTVATPPPVIAPVVAPPSLQNAVPPTGTRSFSSSSKFVVPFGVRSVRIEVTAGGGGGGASCTSMRKGGGSGVGARQVGTFVVAGGELLDVNMVAPESGRCGGGNGGRGGSAAVRGAGINIFANGGTGGIGTGGRCGFCGGDGGPSSATISW